MENHKIKLRLEQIQTYKENNEWHACIDVYHDIEAILLEMPESKQLLDCYLELFHLYYIIGDLPKAFNYFALTEPLLLEYGEWQQYTKFMQSVVKTTFFYARKSEIESFVEHLVPIAFEQEQFEVLSHCFLTQSFIHLLDGSVDLSIQEAKMAYFYGQFVEGDSQQFVVCNAQLQIVLALIETIALESAQYYIEQFGWSVNNCQTDGDRLLVLSVQSMVDMLNHKFDTAIPTLVKVLEQLVSSDEIMYSTILTRQIKLVLQKTQNFITVEQFTKLNGLCDDITARFTMKQSILMYDFVTLTDSLIDKIKPKIEQSTNVFYLGQKLFNEAKSMNKALYCKIIRMNYNSLSDAEQQQFMEHLVHAQFFEGIYQPLISQFSRELLIVVAIVPPASEEANEIFLIPDFSNHSKYVHYNTSTNIFSNFHQLFNYVFFNQLLEINLDPFKQSLA